MSPATLHCLHRILSIHDLLVTFWNSSGGTYRNVPPLRLTLSTGKIVSHHFCLVFECVIYLSAVNSWQDPKTLASPTIFFSSM
jgi:hypothetical protein